jgi:hypothetical protein
MVFAFIVQRGGLPAKCFKRRHGLKTSFLVFFTRKKCLETNEYMREQLLI